MDLLPDGLVARPPTTDDIERVTTLLRAEEEAVAGEAITTASDMAGAWARPSVDLASHAVLVLDGEVLVGYADQHQGKSWGAVHPDHMGRGIGTALLAWIEAAAVAQGVDRVGQPLSDRADAAKALLGAAGYTPRWHSWIFSIPLADVPPPPELDAGLGLRPMIRLAEEAAVHVVIEDAFGEWPDRDQPTSFEDWHAEQLDRDDVEVLVITDADGILGAAVLIDEGTGEGWVEQLAVVSTHRGRGLARALLQASFRLFAQRGCATAGLATDSRTGARALYERVGMQVMSTWTQWSRELT